MGPKQQQQQTTKKNKEDNHNPCEDFVNICKETKYSGRMVNIIVYLSRG